MEEEIGYDSDQIDEETEARFYEKAYYGTSSFGNSTLNEEKFANFSYRPINDLTKVDDKSGSTLTKAMDLLSNLKNEGSSESSSDANVSRSVISTSSCLSSPGDIFKDKERYRINMEAIYFLITGNYPYCVLERAKKREQEYKHNRSSSRRNNYYSAATDDEDDDYKEPHHENSKADMILGISNTLDQKNCRNVVSDRFKNLPSDPKFWSLDPDDLYPLDNHYTYRDFSGNCENCGLKGHTQWECTRSGAFCVICAGEGHLKEECSRRVCPVCFRRGHDSRCRDRHQINNIVCFRCKQMGHMVNRCPEIWRQYRFTTKPGPPVKFEQTEPEVKRCFNCGRVGHLGHECDRPSAYGQTLLNQSVTQFDKKDVFAETPAENKPECEAVKKQSAGDSSVVKVLPFDEPLYVSFTSGPLNSLPGRDKLLLDALQDDSQNGDQRKNKDDRRKSRGSKDDNHHQNGLPNLFISNCFTPKNNECGNSSTRDYIGFRGKSPRNSSFNGSRNNRSRHTKGPSGDRSFGNGNRKKFRGKSPGNSLMQSHFHHSPQHDYRQNRWKASKSPNSRYRSQISPLQRILENRDKILKAGKRRNSGRKSLPNIANSPYLKLIKKKAWNDRSPASCSRPKRQKIILKNRLSR
nr:zinc finger CCHC domain containing protein 7 [Hymenolepis microstoma]